MYKNQAISQAITAARGNPSPSRTAESDKAIIAALRMENKQLKAKIAKIQEQNGESYEEKYETLLKENRELKEQLKKAYVAW